VDCIRKPFRGAERIRDPLGNDRIFVVSRVADKSPAVSKSLAEKVRQIARASDPLGAGSPAKRFFKTGNQPQCIGQMPLGVGTDQCEIVTRTREIRLPSTHRW
jgi:hypothetical protein